jgi:hypothetical protein
MAEEPTEDPCRFCTSDNGVDTVVYRGAHFRVEYGEDVAVPGWMIVTLERHAEGVWSLDDAEARELGEVLRDVSTAIRDAAGVEKVYFGSFGERYPHFHALVSGKPLAIEANASAGAYSGRNGPRLLTDYGDFVDTERAAQVGQQIGAIMQERRPGQSPQ